MNSNQTNYLLVSVALSLTYICISNLLRVGMNRQTYFLKKGGAYKAGVQKMARQQAGAVQSCSIQELFKRLCTSILNHSAIQPSSIIDFCFHKPIKQPFLQDRNRLQYLVGKMMATCMDVILLRQWEWRTTDTHCISHCLGVSLSLHYQGQSTKAESLATAMTWLLEGNTDLIEADGVLQFLFLLSSTGNYVMDTPLTRDDHIYSYYPR